MKNNNMKNNNMKNIYLLLSFCFSFLAFAQAQIPPQAFNYSGVARNSTGQPIATTNIGVQISILKSSTTGTVQYCENHIVNTDAYGLFNLIIGTGGIQSGSMSAINWSNDNYYLKVGMDVNGGTNFLDMGTTQLLSVPYALHSKTADSIIGMLNETDPLFTSSIASSISAIDTLRWNNKQNTLTPGSGIVLIGDTISSVIQYQTLNISNDTIFLTNGGFVKLPNNSVGSIASPLISTNGVIGITSNSATFEGNIQNATQNQITERGFVYSTSPFPNINSNKIIVGTGIGVFSITTDLNNPLFNQNTTYYVRAYVITENTIPIYGNEVSFTTLAVGQIGQGGGTVFFDKGVVSNGWRYLEISNSDIGPGVTWGCDGLDIIGISPAFGSGQNNTNATVASCNDVDFAAKVCDNLILGNQNDWFLPSLGEINLVFFNSINNVINLNNTFYWTSTSTDGYYANIFHGYTGVFPMSTNKFQPFPLRAVRAY